nr:MAG TPA: METALLOPROTEASE, VIBRIO CHOLERAE, PRTV, N-TERMINAL [Caudoviricetes sp.]
MALHTVRCPNPEYTGAVGHDIFVNGVCQVVDDADLEYYRRHGYTIDGEDNPAVSVDTSGDEPFDPEKANKKALEEWLTARGEIVAGMTAEELRVLAAKIIAGEAVA